MAERCGSRVRTRARTARDPYSQEWVESVLARLAQRAREGEPEDGLRRELYEMLHPWAMAKARGVARRLPPHADRDETESQVLLAVFRATQRVDFERYRSFPQFLDLQVRMARVEGARSDDVLSRRHRKMRSEYKAMVNEAEQRLGRHLTVGELHEVARTVVPDEAREDWCDALVHPGANARLPFDDHTPHPVAETGDPLRLVLDHEMSHDVGEWLASLPGTLQEEIHAWFRRKRRPRELPRRLRERLEPYLGELLVKVTPVGDESDGDPGAPVEIDLRDVEARRATVGAAGAARLSA